MSATTEWAHQELTAGRLKLLATTSKKMHPKRKYDPRNVREKECDRAYTDLKFSESIHRPM